jgi:two-component system response regulator (stage 0 sporulation protein F)
LAKTVLVVDDQYGIRLLLEEVLTREGYEVLLAATGLEALRCVHSHRPDLVLLDMKIPGMNGIDILTNIRKTHPNTKVAMMTAYGELDMIREAQTLGALAYFAKPFDIDEIRQFVGLQLGEAGDVD